MAVLKMLYWELKPQLTLGVILTALYLVRDDWASQQAEEVARHAKWAVYELMTLAWRDVKKLDQGQVEALAMEYPRL